MLAVLGAGHLLLVVATGAASVSAPRCWWPVPPSRQRWRSRSRWWTSCAGRPVTEAFAWLATAESVGAALGSAVTGGIVDRAGPVPALGVAAAAGIAAMLIAIVRRPTLEPRPAVPGR